MRLARICNSGVNLIALVWLLEFLEAFGLVDWLAGCWVLGYFVCFWIGGFVVCFLHLPALVWACLVCPSLSVCLGWASWLVWFVFVAWLLLLDCWASGLVCWRISLFVVCFVGGLVLVSAKFALLLLVSCLAWFGWLAG